MTPDVRREALAVLAEVWPLSPDVRLGRLLAHVGFLGEVHVGVGRGLGYVGDDELMAILYGHRAELRIRLERTPHPAPQRTGAAISVSVSPTQVEAVPAAGLGR